MAKSIRAKSKMANRKKKREGGHYAAADAARVERLSAKLLGKGKGKGTVKGEDVKEEEGDEGEEAEEEGGGEEGGDAEMEDVPEEPKKVSTSGTRGTRREQWRASKGMPIRPKSHGMNRQGLAKGRSKAGKPKRRR